MVKKVITDIDLLKVDAFNGGSKELSARTFIHTGWTHQYVSEGVLFSRLVEALIGGPSI